MGKNARFKRERRSTRVTELSEDTLAIELPPGDMHTNDESLPHRSVRWFSSTAVHISLLITLCIVTGVFPIEAHDIF
jgi:hypothetical protein